MGLVFIRANLDSVTMTGRRRWTESTSVRAWTVSVTCKFICSRFYLHAKKNSEIVVIIRFHRFQTLFGASVCKLSVIFSPVYMGHIFRWNVTNSSCTGNCFKRRSFNTIYQIFSFTISWTEMPDCSSTSLENIAPSAVLLWLHLLSFFKYNFMDLLLVCIFLS